MRWFGSRTSVKAHDRSSSRIVKSLPALPSGTDYDDLDLERARNFNSRSSFRKMSKKLRRTKSARKAPKENKRIEKELIGSPRSSGTLKSNNFLDFLKLYQFVHLRD